MPIFIMFTFKGRNIGADAKVRFDIHGEGDVRLVVVRECALTHSWITTP